ncbi:MAG: hypothetical protein KKC68_09420, partial [Candidatus Thermoplasmatota archaeon]|nr:hypothetical protein [Candidatus Thermoplasmatota archaeon]
ILIAIAAMTLIIREEIPSLFAFESVYFLRFIVEGLNHQSHSPFPSPSNKYHRSSKPKFVIFFIKLRKNIIDAPVMHLKVKTHCSP